MHLLSSLRSLLDSAEGAVEGAERLARTLRGPGAAPSATSAPPASARRGTHPSRVRIEEVIDAETGRPEYLVHGEDGSTASCSSEAFAKHVRDRLV